MGEVVSIASQKGGVGKTTTAVNLGAAFAHLNYRTLIIDLDPQGGIASSFGMSRYDIKGGILQLFTENMPIEQTIHSTELSNLDLIPCNVWSDDDEKRKLIGSSAESKLKACLRSIKEDYDYFLIDCPPALGNLTYNGLIASDSIIVPIQCEYYALKALGRFLKLTRTIKEEYNPSLKYRGFLLTMYDSRNNLTKRVVEKVKYTLKGMVFETVIPRNVRLAEVPYYGRPVMLFDQKCKGSQSYMQLAEEIVASNQIQIKKEVA